MGDHITGEDEEDHHRIAAILPDRYQPGPVQHGQAGVAEKYQQRREEADRVEVYRKSTIHAVFGTVGCLPYAR